MDRSLAEKVVGHFDKVFENLNEALYLVNNAEVGEMRKKFQSVIATVVSDIDVDLLEPIFKEYPDLRPEGLEEIRN